MVLAVLSDEEIISLRWSIWQYLAIPKNYKQVKVLMMAKLVWSLALFILYSNSLFSDHKYTNLQYQLSCLNDRILKTGVRMLENTITRVNIGTISFTWSPVTLLVVVVVALLQLTRSHEQLSVSGLHESSSTNWLKLEFTKGKSVDLKWRSACFWWMGQENDSWDYWNEI